MFQKPWGSRATKAREFKVELGTDETSASFHIGPVEGDGTQVLEVRTTYGRRNP